MNLEAVSSGLERLVRRHLELSSAAIGKAPSYAVDFKARNSDTLKRQDVIDAVTKVMGMGPEFCMQVCTHTLQVRCPPRAK